VTNSTILLRILIKKAMLQFIFIIAVFRNFYLENIFTNLSQCSHEIIYFGIRKKILSKQSSEDKLLFTILE